MEEKNLNKFLKLVNIYYERLLSGVSVHDLVSQLDTECFLYDYNKIAKIDDLSNYVGFIEKQEDKEENWYALSYAVYRFLGNNFSNNQTIDKYILQMT